MKNLLFVAILILINGCANFDPAKKAAPPPFVLNNAFDQKLADTVRQWYVNGDLVEKEYFQPGDLVFKSDDGLFDYDDSTYRAGYIFMYKDLIKGADNLTIDDLLIFIDKRDTSILGIRRLPPKKY